MPRRIGGFAMALLAACANSGLGQTDDTDDTDTEDVGTCPWVGSWTLTQITCGSIEATEWYDAHTGATLELSHASGGGCDAVASITGYSCNRTESWTFPAPTSTDVAVTFEGVTACVPNACLFEPYATPCAVGSITGSATVTIVVSGTTMSMTAPIGAVGPFTDTLDCPLEVGTAWSSAPPT